MQIYHFDVGNSSTGRIGLCACINAASRQEALDRLKKLLEDNTGPDGEVEVLNSGPEYITFYINPDAFKLRDIDFNEPLEGS